MRRVCFCVVPLSIVLCLSCRGPRHPRNASSEALVAAGLLSRAEANWPTGVSGDILVNALYAPFDVQIADRFFTPNVRQRVLDCYSNRYLRSGMPYYCTAHFGRSSLPAGLRLPGDTWRTVIPDAPLVKYSGPCPMCGETFGGVEPNLDVSHTARTKCCGRMLYSHAEDVPEAYPLSYDVSMELPYMDGTIHRYRYPSGTNDQVFLPAGIIAAEIQRRLFFTVMPSLTLQVLKDSDAEAAQTLACILDREAELFSGLPWVDLTKASVLGFARYRDIPAMLPTTLTHLAASFWGEPEAYISGRTYQRLNEALLQAPIGTFSGSVKPSILLIGADGRTTRQGTLAEAWDAISKRQEVKAYNRTPSEDDLGLESRVIAMLKTQAAYVRHDDFDRGNFVISLFAGAVPLSVVTKDQAMAENIVDKMFTHLMNHHFAEGISHEGAFNYAHMMSAAFEPIVAREAFGVDFTPRFPWVKRIYDNGDYPVVTLLNIESTHGDEHAAFFSSVNLPPPEAVEYEKHETSQVFPEYGLTCLRAGDPGSRLEVIMSHQNSIMHTDPDRLAIQLFYEGVNLLPDIGYMTKGSNVGKAEEEVVTSDLPIIPEPLKQRYDYNDSAEAHCNALINGNQFGLHCATFERFSGGQSKDEAGYLSQFVQVDGSPVYAEHIEPVDTYTRQLLTLNFSDGRPVVFDVFRLRGGHRHDFFWHVPATRPESSLGEPGQMAESNLHEYFTRHANPPPGWRKEEDPFLRFYENRNWPYKDDVLKRLVDPVCWLPDKDQVWSFRWRIDPERYAPELRTENEAWAKWSLFQKPVNLRIWGISCGSEADETLLSAFGPWGAHYQGFGGLQFGDALSYLVEHRQGKGDLASTFVHLLEPYTDSQGPNVKRVERFKTPDRRTPTGAD